MNIIFLVSFVVVLDCIEYGYIILRQFYVVWLLPCNRFTYTCFIGGICRFKYIFLVQYLS